MKKIFTGMLVGIMAFVAMTTPTTVEAEEIPRPSMQILNIEDEVVVGNISDRFTNEGITYYAKWSCPKSGPYITQVMWYVQEKSTNKTLVVVNSWNEQYESKITMAYELNGCVTPTWNKPDLVW